jgi:hypothetical protein
MVKSEVSIKEDTSDDVAIQPIESVKTNPNKSDELCWNCKANGKDNRLTVEGICDICGFNKSMLYNGNIEADKTAQRAEAARQAERG